MDKKIKELYEDISEDMLTLQGIADEVGTTYTYVWAYVEANYTKEIRDARKKLNYRFSKLGEKNPMLGKSGSLHHNFVGEVSDGKGYLMILRPDWYTGRQGCKHVFVHHVVMCILLGITEIPAGFSVHHIDGDPTNNDACNLALMTMAAHTRLHQLERATTRRKP